MKGSPGAGDEFVSILECTVSPMILSLYVSRLQKSLGDKPVSLKLLFIDYKYGRIWYQCKGNDMRIIITLIPNKKKNLERRNRQS